MLNPANLTVNQVLHGQQPVEESVVNNVFKVFHGFYGNLFLNKFATGTVSASGDDEGIVSARKVWAHGLAEFDVGTVKAALRETQTAHPVWPPSMPEFVGICRARAPRAVSKAVHSEVKALPMGQKLRSAYAARSREIIARHAQRLEDSKSGYVELPQTLEGLKQAIAGAIGLAGGDEAAALLRLDRELTARSA